MSAVRCLFILLAVETATAQIQVVAVTDSATFTPGLVAYGSLASVFCTGLTGIEGVQRAIQYPLPNEIAGVSVRLGGLPAPMLAVANFGSYQQINIQMPGGSGGTLEVSQSDNTGSIAARPASQWGAFFTDASGYVIAEHLDYTLVTPEHPAQPGEILAVYGTNLTGYGVTLPNHPALGYPSPTSPLATIHKVETGYHVFSLVPFVMINGQNAEMLWVGLAPGLVGVFQMNFRVPVAIQDGDAIINAVRGNCTVLPYTCFDFSNSIGAKLPVRASGPVH